MGVLNLSFIDETYSLTNKPSVVTLKNDLQAIQDTINALDETNFDPGAALPYSILDLSSAIVNADIATAAAIAISKTTLGTFTDWTAWTPTWTASGSMTIVDSSNTVKEYSQVGKIAHLALHSVIQTGGTASNTLIFSAPVAPTYTTSLYVHLGCRIADTGSSVSVAGYCFYNGSNFSVRKYNGSNFGIGAGIDISVSGFYRVT